MQVTLFKRSCKTVVSTALASRDPSIEAIEDAALYFESVFAQPDSSLRESPQLFNNVMTHPAQRLLSSLVLTMYASTLSATPQLSPAAQTQFMVAFSRPCSQLRLTRFSHYSSQCVS
ncbi:hypothetical protein DSO57_1023716 [Entomophthora muscae]|uniref:Uncharacterized protein n=1 Tax=Entomophthora muscae TaxID=34485 RepID=A0ACC2UCM1_9FUNG|nr:hypothetical protein DSO57_1023716 [Entomophthora muscae]